MSPVVLIRRGVMVPAVVLLEIVMVLTSPMLLAVAAVLGLARRSGRPARSVALVLAFVGIELRTLARLLRPVEDWDALVAAVLSDGHRAMSRILDVPVVVEEGSPTRDDLGRSDGVIVLARHCGPGDSVYVAWLLAVHYGLSLRVVLKNLLRLEPTIDLAGDRLPFCFVGHRPGAGRAGVTHLASTLARGDALLLFPEGGNFSRQRWQTAIDRLAAQGDHLRAARARRRTHTLPPRTGGALAALQAAPHADVLLVAHSGFSADGRERPWWRVPLHREFAVRTVLVPAVRVPRDEAGALAFLDRSWSQVDTWVEGHADLLTADLL